jgi:hypothetical protein
LPKREDLKYIIKQTRADALCILSRKARRIIILMGKPFANMDYSKITLGELLSSDNETIKRNAVGILKKLQKDNIITITISSEWDEVIPCVNCGNRSYVLHYEKIGKMTKLMYGKCADCGNEENV